MIYDLDLSKIDWTDGDQTKALAVALESQLPPDIRISYFPSDNKIGVYSVEDKPIAAKTTDIINKFSFDPKPLLIAKESPTQDQWINAMIKREMGDDSQIKFCVEQTKNVLDKYK